MSDWRPAKCLNVLREQVDRAYPDRPQSADGMIAGAAHHLANPTSDHEPNAAGVVTAWDITTDPRFTDKLAEDLRVLGKGGDRRVKYVIFKHRFTSAQHGWEWVPYGVPGGVNPHGDPHENHIHLSVSADPKQYDRTGQWPVVFDHGGGKGTSAPITPTPAPPTEEDDMTPEQEDALVAKIVKVLLHGGPGGSALVATHGDMVTLLHGTKPDANGVTTHPNSLDSIAKAVGVKQ